MWIAQKLMLAVFFLLSWVLPVFAQGPQLTIDNPQFEFGEILQGESLEHVFTFRNTGDGNLVISKVRSSCGCTAALLSADVVAPGQEGEVRATFNSGHFRGNVEKSIYLTSNDPRQVSTTLRLRGRVLPLIDAPSDVDLGSFAPGERREVRVSLTNRGKEKVVLTSVESSSPAVRVARMAANLLPGEAAEILLRAELPDGMPANGYLIIRTDSPRAAEIRLPFYGAPVSRR